MNIPNSPTSDDGYEYTDDDFAEAMQPYWMTAKLKRKKTEEEVRKEKAKAWMEKYGKMEEELREAAHRKWEEEENEERYGRIMQPGQADYEFDNLDENRTPEGWPESFYEY